MRTTTSLFLRTFRASQAWRQQQPLCPWLYPPSIHKQCRRSYQTTTIPPNRTPNFAFAFDIDGVLLRSSSPLPRARSTLLALQRLRIPFILLTNGGGRHEHDRVRELSHLLSIPLSPSMFIQSHTPFADLVHQTSPEDPTKTPLAEKTILVTGGDGERCRKVAEAYGFRSVVIPADIITANPTIWPFTSPQNYESHARPLPLPIYDPSSSSRPPSPDTNLTIHSIFIYNDPRDWALDTQILLDVLLSDRGILGTTTATNEQQLPLYFSNPDILFSSHHPHPRLGQGAFLAAFLGVWDAVTGGKQPLKYSVIGKPSQSTFEFAEKKLREHRRGLLGLPPTNTNGAEEVGAGGLRKVYMIGDNPASDILGGNSYKSPFGSQWDTILVRSGVFNSSSSPQLSSEYQPTKVVDDVWDAVEWALGKEKWLDGEKLEPKETGEEGNSWMQGGPVIWGEKVEEVKG